MMFAHALDAQTLNRLMLCIFIFASLQLIGLYVCMSDCLSVRPSVRLSVCLPVLLPICLFVCSSVYVCLSVYMSVCPSIRLSLCLSVCLSVYHYDRISLAFNSQSLAQNGRIRVHTKHWSEVDKHLDYDRYVGPYVI